MRTSDSIVAIAAALAKAQGELGGAKKDSTNPHFKSKYADLSSVVDALKACFPANGLSYVQTIVTGDHGVGVETMLLHESGEWICGDPFLIPVNKADAQGFGSALTYARRYSLSAIAGVKADDDDGNAAAAAVPNDSGTAVAARIAAANITGANVNKEAFDALSAENKDWISHHAREVQRLFDAKEDVFGYVEAQKFDGDFKSALWYLLASNVRSALAKAKKEMQPPHKDAA